MEESLIWVACILFWSFLIIPPIYYLRTTRKLRYENLKSYLSENIIEKYYDLFFPSIKKEGNLKEDFENRYIFRYGWIRYIFPLVLFFTLSGIGLFFVKTTCVSWLKSTGLKPMPPIALSAFFGAYVWVAFDQLRKIRMRNFTLYDIYSLSLRFLIAIPSGYAFAALVKEPVGIPIAFFIGAFPLSDLIKYFRRFVSMQLGIGDEGTSETSELEKVQGINRLEAERYQSIGKSNLLDLAYSDPIDTTLRTNLEFIYVIDCMGQSLLWIYFGNYVDDLRKLGLRSSFEAMTLWDHYNSSHNRQRKKIAKANINEIAKILEVSEETLLRTLFEIVHDPHAEFLKAIWGTERQRHR